MIDQDDDRQGLGTAEANAALIVEAVNSHASLVAENARLRDALAPIVKDVESAGALWLISRPLIEAARSALGGAT